MSTFRVEKRFFFCETEKNKTIFLKFQIKSAMNSFLEKRWNQGELKEGKLVTFLSLKTPPKKWFSMMSVDAIFESMKVAFDIFKIFIIRMVFNVFLVFDR